jgi:hypothetical protein
VCGSILCDDKEKKERRKKKRTNTSEPRQSHSRRRRRRRVVVVVVVSGGGGGGQRLSLMMMMFFFCDFSMIDDVREAALFRRDQRSTHLIGRFLCGSRQSPNTIIFDFFSSPALRRIKILLNRLASLKNVTSSSSF